MPKLFAFSRWERWDSEQVLLLLQELPRTHTDLRQLEWIKANLNVQDYVEISYFYAEGLDFGRAYAKHGFQRVTKGTRRRCARKYYWDLDLKNAFPCIAMQLFQGCASLRTFFLSKYVAERESVIAQILKLCPYWNFDSIKTLFVASLHQGNYRNFSDKVVIPFLEDFQREVRRNCKALMKANPHLVELARELGRGNFVAGNVMSWMCQRVEADIMSCASQFLEQHGHELGTYLFDGEFVFKFGQDHENTNQEVPLDLASLEEFVFHTVGYRIKFAIKSMEMDAIPTDVYPRNCDNSRRIVLFDYEQTLCSLEGGKFTPRPGIQAILKLKAHGYRIGLFSNKTNNRLRMKDILPCLPGLEAFDVVLTGEFCAGLPDYDFHKQGLHKYGKKHLKQKPLAQVCSLEQLLLVDFEPLRVNEQERHRVRVIPPWFVQCGAGDDAIPKVVDHILSAWDAPLAPCGPSLDRAFWHKDVKLFDRTDDGVQVLLPVHADTRLLCVRAGMACGKTYRSQQLICALMENKGIPWRHHMSLSPVTNAEVNDIMHLIGTRFGRVLVVASRQTLSQCQVGFYPGFAHYRGFHAEQQEGVLWQASGSSANPDLFITQYESLHRTALHDSYDMVVTDEIRTMCDNVTCIKTNPGTRLHDNYEQLKCILRAAKLTLALDDDLEHDCAVAKLFETVFTAAETEVHRYLKQRIIRFLEIHDNKERFLRSIHEALDGRVPVAIFCRTKRMAQVHALQFDRPGRKTTLITSDTSEEDIKGFRDINRFLQDTALLISTARMTAGTDIQLPFIVFVDFRGMGGCCARNMTQMLGRVRNCVNDSAANPIQVLCEKAREGKRIDVEKMTQSYAYIRSVVKQKYRILLREHTDYDVDCEEDTKQEMMWAPQGLSAVYLAQLQEQWQDKIWALQDIARRKQWTVTVTKSEEKQSVFAEEALAAQKKLKRLRKEELQEVFRKSKEMNCEEQNEVLAQNRYERNLALDKLANGIRVLRHYQTELSFEDFEFACSNHQTISNFALIAHADRFMLHDLIQHQVHELKEDKKIWMMYKSRFHLVQMAIMKEVFRLLGIENVDSFGTLVPHTTFVQHEAKLLQLTKHCAIAGKRFDKYHKRTTKIPGNAAVTAVRRELNAVWGTTVKKTLKRKEGDRIGFHVYFVHERVKRLAECSDHCEHLINLQLEQVAERQRENS